VLPWECCLASRFFGTPKGLLIVVLGALTVLALAFGGATRAIPSLLGATVAGVLVDAPILRLREDEWVFPDGALLTGWIVAMVLSPFESWYVAAATSATGVLSKYVFRSRRANVFNPAALALVLAFYVFHSGQDWWGSLPALSWAGVAALLATGWYISDRVNKLPVVVSFLLTWFGLVTVSAFAADPASVARLYRPPDLHAALYFAFFMVNDPPTSPPKHDDQLVYGTIVGVAAFVVYEMGGAAWYLLGGLLVANVWEAWRRLPKKKRAEEFPPRPVANGRDNP